VELANGDVHLSLVQDRDGSKIDQKYWSVVSTEKRGPLPANGGHGEILKWVGVSAVQVAPGNATGAGRGFSIIKTGHEKFEIGTFRSGLKRQDAVEKRPGFATGTADEPRTLAEENIFPLLAQLTGGIILSATITDGRPPSK